MSFRLWHLTLSMSGYSCDKNSSLPDSVQRHQIVDRHPKDTSVTDAVVLATHQTQELVFHAISEAVLSFERLAAKSRNGCLEDRASARWSRCIPDADGAGWFVPLSRHRFSR